MRVKLYINAATVSKLILEKPKLRKDTANRRTVGFAEFMRFWEQDQSAVTIKIQLT